MKASDNSFYDLVKRIEDNFMEIDSDILVDLRNHNEEYSKLCFELGEMESKYPFILEVTEGKGKMVLTAEEHEILTKYFHVCFRKEDMERRQIYFRGHTDGYAYLKKIGAV